MWYCTINIKTLFINLVHLQMFLYRLLAFTRGYFYFHFHILVSVCTQWSEEVGHFKHCLIKQSLYRSIKCLFFVCTELSSEWLFYEPGMDILLLLWFKKILNCVFCNIFPTFLSRPCISPFPSWCECIDILDNYTGLLLNSVLWFLLPSLRHVWCFFFFF